ncbi:MAG: uroporphyrinogen-III synthase [Proteobacteria bacterium]|nr:uroporphyrinogen-III synthase [Pseudomonadota bacterium]
MKSALITRTKNSSAEIIKFLENRRFQVFCEPLFTVEKLSVEKISTPISAAIITSSNACLALENSGIAKETKIFTVGEKTAERLKQSGFQNIVLSPKNSADSLFDLLTRESGPIVYFRGSVISFDFAKKLENVREIHSYKTCEIENFSTDFRKIPYDQVLIFSKNSCEIFYKIITRNNLLEYFTNSQILCLSQQILERARDLGFKKLSKIEQF